MLFSIIIPIYNADEFLAEALYSLVGQTIHNFEVILINDGSKDNSENVCKEFITRYPDIFKYYYKENSGQFLTRQFGVVHAIGQYILYIDADDYIREDTIQKLTETVENVGADVILFNAMKFSYEKKYPLWPQLCEDKRIFEDDEKIYLYYKIISSKELNNICLKAIKRNLIDLTYDIDKRINIEEDLLQFLPIITSAKKIIYINEYFYFYRDNPCGITQRFNQYHYFSTKSINKEIEKYIRIWGIEERKDLCSVRFMNNIYGSLLQIMSPNCNYNIKEKLEYIKSIYSDEYFKNNFIIYRKIQKHDPKMVLFTSMFYQYKLITLTLINNYQILRKIKRYYQSILKKFV